MKNLKSLGLKMFILPFGSDFGLFLASPETDEIVEIGLETFVRLSPFDDPFGFLFLVCKKKEL